MEHFKKGLFTILGVYAGCLIVVAINDVAFGKTKASENVDETEEDDE